MVFGAPTIKKGPCDDTLECKRYDFSGSEKALCFGYYGCKGASFDTDLNAVCSGTKACLRGQFNGLSTKVLCHGFGSCMRSRGLGSVTGLVATTQVNCKGFRTCEAIVGGVNAPNIYCNGDLSCTNVKSTLSTTDLNLNAVSPTVTGKVYCNGNGACKQTQIRSDYSVYCDGDGGCQNSRIESEYIECQGKRVCKDSTLQFAHTLKVYGWFGAVRSTILETKYIEAYGFNSLAFASISTRGEDLTLYAYGYRALASAYVDCGGGSTCHIACDTNACKGVPVYVSKNSFLTVEPAECDPMHPDYTVNKKDSTLPGKVAGIHCPVIERAGKVDSNNHEVTDEDLETKKMAFIALRRDTDEYRQFLEQEEIAEQAFEARMDEKLSDYQLLPNYDEEEQENQYVDSLKNGQSMFGLSGILMNGKNRGGEVNLSAVVTYNILTAFAVFMATGTSVYCYVEYKNKYGGYKSLPQ